MSDTKPEPNYQDILDKYAAGIKSSTEPSLPQPEPELESKQEPESLLETELTSESKLEIHSQPEIEASEAPEPELKPEPEAELQTIPKLEDQPKIQPQPEFPPQPELKPPSQPLNITAPPAPEAIIPPTPPVNLPPESSLVSHPNENNFFKYLFFLSLIIFLGVLAAIVYSFINTQKPFNTSSNTPTIAPTLTPELFCEINGQKYTVGQSFPATDGCNSCSCDENLQISCTTMACEATPSVKITPTKSATSAAVLKSAKEACELNKFTWISKYSECEDGIVDSTNLQKLKTICETYKGKLDTQANSCRHVVVTDTNPCGPETVAVCSFSL